MTTRRSFLRYGLSAASALAAGWALPSLRARAGARGPCRLVIVLAYGGWDPTWVFDPKPDSDEVDLIPGDVQMFGDLAIWTDPSRPAVTEFFSEWGSRSAVINGVSVESLAHETCAKVMLTGDAEGERPDLGARVADHNGRELALPYLTLSPHAKNRGLEAQAGALGDSNQLMALASGELAWPAPGELWPDPGLDLSEGERELVAAYLETRGRAVRDTHADSPRSAALLDDYLASVARAERLQANARAGGALANAQLFESTESPWDHVAGAFADGLSQVALIQPNLYWDTHAYNSEQGPAYEELFATLSALMAALAGAGVLDDTVVLALSEMGRTPRHNSLGGKDHWPWTSAMLVGPNLASSRVVGRTDAWLRPEPDEPALHAGHVLATAARLVGADPTSWYTQEPIDALLG